MGLPAHQPPFQPHFPGFDPPERDTVYFDLETQHTFDEVGGRHQIGLLRLAVAITYSATSMQFKSYTEAQVQDLLLELREAGLVIGFNIREFDYKVLQPYASFQLSQIRTLDIMDHVVGQLGFRLSLDALATATLGETKTADGLQAVRWFREGNLQQVTTYCEKDVEITRKLFEFGKSEGCLFYFDRRGGKRRLEVNWARSGPS